MSAVSRFRMIVSLTFLAACAADSTTPTPPPAPLSITVAATQVSAGHQVLNNGVTSWACGYTFSARANGGSPTDFNFAVWTSGEINYRLNSNGAQYNQFLFSTDIQDWFGSDELHTGATQNATRTFSWSGPFTATVLFRYFDAGQLTPPGASHTATVFVNCS